MGPATEGQSSVSSSAHERESQEEIATILRDVQRERVDPRALAVSEHLTVVAWLDTWFSTLRIRMRDRFGEP